MRGRAVIYFAWDRERETGAPLGVIDNRFPALFESRRMLYPRYADLADPARFDQGIDGFLDHIQRPNFTAFAELASSLTQAAVREVERGDADGGRHPITGQLLAGVDTLVVISFDSEGTDQRPAETELAALRGFLEVPGNLVVVAPHHDIGDEPVAEFAHHGDRTIPPEQRFSGFARAVLAGLGVPVANQFGLRPATLPDGQPAPIDVTRAVDRLGLLAGVTSLNLHPHLPHFERMGPARELLDVLARQPIDLHAPPHRFTATGRTTFDAVLQSRPGVFAGDLVIGDTTLFSSTAGGTDSLRRLWTNLLQRPRPAA